MKWMNHVLLTGTLVYGFTGGKVFFTLAAVAGSLFPDKIEGRAPEEDEKLKKWHGASERAVLAGNHDQVALAAGNRARGFDWQQTTGA